ncbi:MAG TPA: MarR family transcriptional regulator [Gemmatimonadaceae bacterium]|nr:MarR family transcriptional regulator [Gemmatimonadaceae bacterium]
MSASRLEHDVTACVCNKTRMAARVVTRIYDEALKPIRLRATQFALLVALGADGAMSIAALAKLMAMDRSTLTRNLRPLESEGLVARGDEGWRRSKGVQITAKGRARLRQGMPLWQSAQSDMLRRLGQSNWTRVQAGLDLLAAIG